MSSEKEAFTNYMNVLDKVRNGNMTIDEAIVQIEKTDGPEYAEIARQSLIEAVGMPTIT